MYDYRLNLCCEFATTCRDGNFPYMPVREKGPRCKYGDYWDKNADGCCRGGLSVFKEVDIFPPSFFGIDPPQIIKTDDFNFNFISFCNPGHGL